MSIENSIILITNKNEVVDILKPKLVLLREVDTLLTSTYTEAVETIKKYNPEIVLLYCDEEEQEGCLSIIKAIKNDESIKNTSILLVLKQFNQDFILNAYEENISDFLTIDTDDAEILIRTIWGIKKYSNLKTIEKQNILLSNLEIKDKTTGFYSNKYCDEVLKIELDELNKKQADSILMLIAASDENKIKLSPEQLAKAIKLSTRTSDFILHAESDRVYVLLENTQLKGAFCVWEKIKKAVGEQYTINAGISTIEGQMFEALKVKLLQALVEAVNTNQDTVIVNNEIEEFETGTWLDKINSSQKNFKLFKQAFNKKLEKVITPVFFQTQKLFEDKLFETTIEQYSNSALSSFVLKKAGKMSELKITYPGFSKINIDILHEGLDTPENRRLSLDLTELEEAKLTDIIEEFINEFKASDK